jgi:hypothetical protein
MIKNTADAFSNQEVAVRFVLSATGEKIQPIRQSIKIDGIVESGDIIEEGAVVDINAPNNAGLSGAARQSSRPRRQLNSPTWKTTYQLKSETNEALVKFMTERGGAVVKVTLRYAQGCVSGLDVIASGPTEPSLKVEVGTVTNGIFERAELYGQKDGMIGSSNNYHQRAYLFASPIANIDQDYIPEKY